MDGCHFVEHVIFTPATATPWRHAPLLPGMAAKGWWSRPEATSPRRDPCSMPGDDPPGTLNHQQPHPNNVGQRFPLPAPSVRVPETLPLPCFSVSRPTRMEQPRFATPCSGANRKKEEEEEEERVSEVAEDLKEAEGRGRRGGRTQEKVLMLAVSCFPVKRRSLPSPYALM